MANFKMNFSTFLIRKRFPRRFPGMDEVDEQTHIIKGLPAVLDNMKKARFTVDIALFLINDSKMMRRLTKLQSKGAIIRLMLDRRHHELLAPYAQELKSKGVVIRWKPAEMAVESKICLVDNNRSDERVAGYRGVSFVLYGDYDASVTSCATCFANLTYSSAESVVNYYSHQFNNLWSIADSDSD